MPNINWDKFFEEVAHKNSQQIGGSHTERTYLNRPQDTLSAWIAIEALRPRLTYKSSDSIISKSTGAMLKFIMPTLPWEENSYSKDTPYATYYELFLGRVDLGYCSANLIEYYGASNMVELDMPEGFSPVISIILDENGRLASDDYSPISVSSYPWAYKTVLAGKSYALHAWEKAENLIITSIEKIISDGSEILQVDSTTIERLTRWIVENYGLTAELQATIDCARYSIRKKNNGNSAIPSPSILNSFYLKDLAQARELLNSNVSQNTLLKTYLGSAVEKPIDVLKDKDTITRVLSAHNFPPARWPSKGRFSLNLLQQFAINTARIELKHYPMLSINGPPGTGKTTLLRDLISSVVIDKVIAMANFENPADAFQYKGKEEYFHFYGIDDSLKGHEIIVASNNNNAVQNITKELPLLGAVEAEIMPRYFRSIAEKITDEPCWGLISVALGNRKNKNEFINKVWSGGNWGNVDTSINHYLQSIYLGQSKISKVTAQDDEGNEFTRLPLIVTEEQAPRNPKEALLNWQKLRQEFNELLNNYEQISCDVDSFSLIQQELSRCEADLPKLKKKVADAKSARENFQAQLLALNYQLSELKNSQEKTEKQSQLHIALKPNFFLRIIYFLIKSNKYEMWAKEAETLYAYQKEIFSVSQQTKNKIGSLEPEIERKHISQIELEDEYYELLAKINSLNDRLKKIEPLLGSMLDSKFWSQSHDEIHKASPTISDKVQHCRDRIFITAIKAQKAFIDAAAKPMRHNLNSFFNLIKRNKSFPGKEHLAEDLWASFFIFVPVVSTTFASISTMLQFSKPNSLGWLLLDEAGQASPQVAVGAMMRFRKALVVGDPLQIQPIESSPKKLVQSIFNAFHVDPHIYAAPHSSCQTLADRISRFGTFIESNGVTTKIGCPLLVHRRCLEPMFGISNKIAYGDLMVHGKEKTFDYSEIPPASIWFNVFTEGSSSKWSDKEGQAVSLILTELLQHSKNPDIFIISPFKEVAQGMKAYLQKTHLLANNQLDQGEWLRSRIGTVHTFQGKEADIVIMILGNASKGAINWACSTPNIVNVAVTRGKRRLYVVGCHKSWAHIGIMNVVSDLLPVAKS